MRYSKLILVTGLVSIAGCAGKVRYPSFYVLNVPAPVAVAGRTQPALGTVQIRQFSAPGFLTEGPITYRQSPNQLGFYNYHHWAEDPRRAVTTAMVRELQSRGLFKSVDLFDGKASPACLITGRLDHLEEVDDGSTVTVEVGLSAELVSLKTDELLWQGTSLQTAKVDQRSVPGVVAEMSRDLGTAVHQLVSSMQDHLSVDSGSQD